MVSLLDPVLDILPVDTVFVESLVEASLVLGKSGLEPGSVFAPVGLLLGIGPLGISVLDGGSVPDWVVVVLGHVSLELPDGDVLGVVGVHSLEGNSESVVDGGASRGIDFDGAQDGGEEEDNSESHFSNKNY